MATHEPAQSPRASEQRFVLASSRIALGDRTLELVHPQSVDELISLDDFNIDERLPYWGAIWPSARVLAQRIAREPGDGRRLLELGCGVGLVALAAAVVGFDVLATDYYAEACQMTAANAQRNGIAGVRTQVVDWRNFPPELAGFDVVLASDVLYDRGNPSLVAAALAQSLAPSGTGWLTDPGRNIAKPFAAECRSRSLVCDCIHLEEVIDGTSQPVVELFEIRHRHRRPPQ